MARSQVTLHLLLHPHVANAEGREAKGVGRERLQLVPGLAKIRSLCRTRREALAPFFD